MQVVSRIVCAVDVARDARHTIAHASALARQLGSELHVLYVRTGGAESPSNRLGACTEAGPRAVSAPAPGSPSGADPRVVAALWLAPGDGSAASEIVRYARRDDLIVINERYGAPRPWRSTLSLAKRVVRMAPCPVVVLTAGASTPASVVRGSITEVVCAVDFGASSMAALRAAVRLVGGHHGRLTLVHVIDGVSDRLVFSGGEAARVLRDHQARVAREKRRLLGLEALRALDPWQVRVVVASGSPSRVILAAAAEVRAGLIAMGTGGRRGPGALRGGTTRRVGRRARCPLLLAGKGTERSEPSDGDTVSRLGGSAA